MTQQTETKEERRLRELRDKLCNVLDHIEVWSTAGAYIAPYPFQYIAYSIIPEGWDDPCEGVGGSLLEALENLYKQVKKYKLL